MTTSIVLKMMRWQLQWKKQHPINFASYFLVVRSQWHPICRRRVLISLPIPPQRIGEHPCGCGIPLSRGGVWSPGVGSSRPNAPRPPKAALPCPCTKAYEILPKDLKREIFPWFPRDFALWPLLFGGARRPLFRRRPSLREASPAVAAGERSQVAERNLPTDCYGFYPFFANDIVPCFSWISLFIASSSRWKFKGCYPKICMLQACKGHPLPSGPSLLFRKYARYQVRNGKKNLDSGKSLKKSVSISYMFVNGFKIIFYV